MAIRSMDAVRILPRALNSQRVCALKNFASAMVFLLPSLAIFFVFIPLLKTIDLSRYLTDPIGLALLQDQERLQFKIVMAGIVLILVPTFALFIAGNRQLIRGLTAGAVKG